MTSALADDASSALSFSPLPVHSTFSDQPILLGPIRPDLIRDEVLADLLEATAARMPDQVALIDGNRQITYQELNDRADHVASRLIEAGVRPGHVIGLWLPRGIALLIMQAGIAKTGAAWLPFDADTPVDRIAVCLDDAASPGIVSCAQFASGLTDTRFMVWTAEQLAEPLEDRKSTRLNSSHIQKSRMPSSA